jgi:hypothetical protein
MAHEECKQVGRWVDENVQQQVEKCVEQDCNWWCACCNKWFCFLVWVVVVVTTWVVETVCTIVLDVVDLVVNIVVGLIDIVVGIFTLDWRRILLGFLEIIGGAVVFVLDLIPIVTGGTLVGAFQEQADRWALRRYVKQKVDTQFADNTQLHDRIIAALGLDGSGFGLHLPTSVMRMSIRSDFSSQPDGTPDLVVFSRTAGNDLKALMNLTDHRWRWDESRVEVVGDDGDISEGDLDAYLAAGGIGDGLKHFTLFSMSDSDLEARLDCADQHAPELGLIFHWHQADTPVAVPEQISLNDNSFTSELVLAPFSRHLRSNDPVAADAELGSPLVIASFRFHTDRRMGISAVMAGHPCVDGGARRGQGITGAAFKSRWPDIGFKYTAIHEVGHTFGLCHVDGLLRIMYTNAPNEDKSIWSGSSLWQYWTNGEEAGFILDEGKSVWDYILANFTPDRLATRLF